MKVRSARTFSPHFDIHARERLAAAVNHGGSANGTRLRARRVSFAAIGLDCNIGSLPGNESGLQPSGGRSTTTRPVVPSGSARLRLDVFLAHELTDFSRSRLQQLIRGKVRQPQWEGGAAARRRAGKGDVVDLASRRSKRSTINRRTPRSDILFEDVDLIVINKPAGLVVHPGAGHRDRHARERAAPSLSCPFGNRRVRTPRHVHRLDKETSGCIVVAKNHDDHRALVDSNFAERTVEKIYLALVAGKMRKISGDTDASIGRHRVDRQRMSVSSARGRAAKTEYRVVRSSDKMSLVECQLHTGRTHQIRVHLHHLGHPVLGDKIYGARISQKFSRQMLGCAETRFHPSAHKPPNEFRSAATE